MQDRLRWYRACAGAYAGVICALVLFTLPVWESVFNYRLGRQIGEWVCYSALFAGPVVGFWIGQMPPRRRHEG